MNTFINTREALAAAVYAFKVNGNTVMKDMYRLDPTDKFPNKAYLYKYFSNDKFCPELPAFTLTDELLVEADSIKQSLEYIVTMAALTKGRLNTFIEECTKLVSQETVNIKSAGTLVWIPKIIFDNELKNAAKMKSAFLEHSSKYIGQIGHRVQFHFNLIEKRFIGNINCWAAYGHTNEGNLVKFLTKHETLCQTGDIKGRIKATDRDSYHGDAQVTSLNHVKKL